MVCKNLAEPGQKKLLSHPTSPIMDNQLPDSVGAVNTQKDNEESWNIYIYI